MDGMEFGRGMTAMAFTIDPSFRFGGDMPNGRHNVATILKGWKPRELSPSLPIGLRLAQELEARFAALVRWRR